MSASGILFVLGRGESASREKEKVAASILLLLSCPQELAYLPTRPCGAVSPQCAVEENKLHQVKGK